MNMNERARAVLRGNDRGGYTIPTDGLYPYQWNWDSAFSALGFATFDRARAWEELEKLFEAQWPNGMVPHIIFRADEPDYFPGPSIWQANMGPMPSSGISQPPVVASVVRALAEAEPERASRVHRPHRCMARMVAPRARPQGNRGHSDYPSVGIGS